MATFSFPYAAQCHDNIADERITKLNDAAEHDDAKAQYELGMSYVTGMGVARDKIEAIHWLRKSANNGNSSAQSYLGTLYMNGDGVPQDITQAIKWWYMAAEKHDSSAECQLGFAYLLGDGVPTNYTQAYMWFDLAAADGDKHAVKDRDTIAQKMAPDHMAEAQRLADEWTQKHPRNL